MNKDDTDQIAESTRRFLAWWGETIMWGIAAIGWLMLIAGALLMLRATLRWLLG